MMPPPDIQRNTVGMDDLRRLGNKAGARQPSQGGPVSVSLGPTSMFNSRSSSGRKPLSGLAKSGEDSGASSRTATPPAAKDKEASTSANAFRYVLCLFPKSRADMLVVLLRDWTPRVSRRAPRLRLPRPPLHQ